MSLQLDERATAKPDVTDYSDHEPSAKRPTLHHYGLITADLDTMVDWYTKLLGARVNLKLGPERDEIQGPPRIVFLGNDVAHHRLTMVELAGTQRNRAERLKYVRTQHSAWEYASIADLLETYERLRGLGVEPYVCGHHGTHVYFFYLDPDENWVELLADGFGDPEKSLEYFRTSEEIRINNIGAFLDPAKMLAAWKEGRLSEEELSQRAFAGEWAPENPPDLRILV